MAAAAECRFEDGKHYEHRHSFGGDSFKGDMLLLGDGSAVLNGKRVKSFSGSWAIGTQASTENNLTLQTSGSTFMMIRQMGDFKQMWVGTCQSDGLVRGDVWDPSLAQGTFTVRSSK